MNKNSTAGKASLPGRASSRSPVSALAAAGSGFSLFDLQQAAGNQAVLRLLGSAGPGGAGEDPRQVQARLGDGRPLQSGLRSRMEAVFGRSFAAVRVHTDHAAALLSERLDARAFTVGGHVAFGAGEYRPGTPAGDALIAHELAHVMQQGEGAAVIAPMARSGEGDAPLERDADQAAAGAVAALWGKARDGWTNLARNAVPRLRTGLRLSRCPKKQAANAAAAACRPKLVSLQAVKTGRVAVTDAWSEAHNCQLRLGMPGMTFQSRVEVPKGCEGLLQYVQVIDRCIEKGDRRGRRQRLKTRGFALDRSDPYWQKIVRGETSTTIDFETNDSPGADDDDHWEDLAVDDTFRMWLLWKPDDPANAPRVPLGKVEWSWHAKAEKQAGAAGCGGAWKILQQGVKDGIGAATDEMPKWKKVSPKDFSWEPGSCAGPS